MKKSGVQAKMQKMQTYSANLAEISLGSRMRLA